MTYMLDTNTNICIYAIKRKPEQVFSRIKENLENGLCLSAITLAELEHGFDEPAAREYGKICAYLQKKGTPIGTMDMLIAGHTRSKDYTLITNNVKEFERVIGLKIENWAE